MQIRYRQMQFIFRHDNELHQVGVICSLLLLLSKDFRLHYSFEYRKTFSESCKRATFGLK